MKFSYNWLQSFFKRKLPFPEKLAELLTLYFAEVEEIKKEGNDFILDIDVRPNRGSDCFSHMGIAREIAAISGFNFQFPSFRLNEDEKLKAKDFLTVKIKDKNACPRYTARVITDVKVKSSSKWIQDRLKVCGLRPISNIVDIANFVMLETGQPLHAFDGEKLAGKKIIVRFSTEGEKITTLDEEKYDLDKNILVIADAKSPLAIAGIKGGKIPEIDEKTKIIVLESANFNSRVIRFGSKRIDLKTDASWRFEHSIDPNLTEFAINRAAHLIQEIAGGNIAKGLIDVYPKRVLPKRIRLDLNYVKSLLGIEISKKEIIKILKNLEFTVKELPKNALDVLIPTRRIDVLMPEDLIEEIGRIHGYQKIPARFPVSLLIPPKRNLDIFWEDVTKDFLKEAGFTEVYNYSFISEKDAEIFKYKKKELVELENALSSDFQYLRPSLIPDLLKNIERNIRDFSEIKIFELGRTFTILQVQDKIREKRMLTGVMTGDTFYHAKGIIDLFLNKLGISNIWFTEPSAHLTLRPAKRYSEYDEYKATPEESKLSFWQAKKCAEIKINHQEIGFLGEISPKILDDLKIKGKICVFDIDFEKLSKLASEEHEYRPISRFPAAVRDIAVLVPRFVRVEEVLNKIEEAGGNLIRDIDLFDIYEGEELPEDKKNLAFHIIYQSENRTLSSEEIDEIQNKIISALEEDPEWQVRK